VSVRPSPAVDALESWVSRYGSLLSKIVCEKTPKDDAVRELLLVRDRIASELQNIDPPSDFIARICELDRQLRKNQQRITLGSKEDREAFRNTIMPPEQNWWWYPETSQNPLWTLAAAFLLTMSATMLTDLARRVFSSDPDEIGILAIAVQATLTIAAGSTFTESGRKWMASLLNRLGVRFSFQPAYKLAATVCLCSVTAAVWMSLPSTLALRYNDEGTRLFSRDPARAKRLYERAISLSPQMPSPHYNLGGWYEDSYQYDRAITEYQIAARLAYPNSIKAYNNLSRVVILQGNPLEALRIADEGLRLLGRQEARDEAHAALDQNKTSAALYKNRAWAELELGFLPQAESDVAQSLTLLPNSAATICVLAKVYEKEQRAAEAYRTWKQFQSASSGEPTSQSELEVEPDCSRLAEAKTHERK
jgi:Tfp pilus assembly protein PilF